MSIKFNDLTHGSVVVLLKDMVADNFKLAKRGEVFRVSALSRLTKKIALVGQDESDDRRVVLDDLSVIAFATNSSEITARTVLQKLEVQATTTPFEIPSESLPKFDERLQQNIDEGFVEGKKSFEYIWQELGKSFDWARVHKMMLAVEWYWSFGNDQNGVDQMGIPCIKTIQSCVYSLLKRAYDEDLASCSSGGFMVGWDGDEMYITFIAEQDSILGKTTF